MSNTVENAKAREGCKVGGQTDKRTVEIAVMR